MDAGIIAVEVSTMPARHRERYSSSLRNLSTITPESCPPSNGITVHDALESPSTMSRNNQLHQVYECSWIARHHPINDCCNGPVEHHAFGRRYI